MKILTVFTGGTIACSSKNGVLFPDKENGYMLLDMYCETDRETEFETAQPYIILSENLQAETLDALYYCIGGYDLSEYDGVVVCHGTDTLQYTGAFLSYRFGLCKTPIVLVSSNYPLDHRRSNGFVNFCAAVGFIKSGQGRGVFIAYNNDGDPMVNIHRAIRTLTHLPFSDNLFSLKNKPYGFIKDGVFIFNPEYREKKSEFEVLSKPIGKRVLYIRPYPGMIYPELTNDYKAVLLDSYHSGTIRTAGKEVVALCASAKEKNIPVYLTGSEVGFNYESKQKYKELGIRLLPPMSPVAAYMKLWLM